ncbi:MAG: glycoside hydrolase family 28 protein [Clostridia bacterium]|nr:glycoside hydrolase family 28 protein [Clostridia bacterium]
MSTLPPQALFIGPRSASFLLDEESCYALESPAHIRINGIPVCQAETAVVSLYDLLPDTEYCLSAEKDGEDATYTFRTLPESVTYNVRIFGAQGDGVHDDTHAIQAAIYACPENGRVLIPRGTYLVFPLFLNSHIRLEIAEGAELRLANDRSRFPILPGMVQTTDEQDDINLGSWEGNPLDAFASLLTGIDVEDVYVYGKGILNGQGDLGDWWKDHKKKHGAFRPRMIFLNHCETIVFQGLQIMRSPAWNVHPYFSKHLGFYSLTITAPADSPNTDGFDPESCEGISMMGVHFSVGDDCIAIKSGKIYMGRRYQTPCKNIEIAHCLMEDGHGGVTVGSEMSGGVQDVHIHHCTMRHTDRGLRIKTRRGRGVQGRIDRICMEHVTMDYVRVPLAVNSMYFCDPDGRSAYVQSRTAQPVDERTPSIGTIVFSDCVCTHATNAGYVLGLPEKPLEHLIVRHVTMQVDPTAEPIACIMAQDIPRNAGHGLELHHVQDAQIDLELSGHLGEAVLYGEGTK